MLEIQINPTPPRLLPNPNHALLSLSCNHHNHNLTLADHLTLGVIHKICLDLRKGWPDHDGSVTRGGGVGPVSGPQ